MATARSHCPTSPSTPTPGAPADHLAQLATFDIGLVPLDDTPFEQAKFPFKLLQYMALGIPPVAAAVGTAGAVIQPGINGQLAASHEQWHACLTHLIENAADRRRLGAAAHDTVAAHYTVERVAPLLAEALRSARSVPSTGAFRGRSPLPSFLGRSLQPSGARLPRRRRQ